MTVTAFVCHRWVDGRIGDWPEGVDVQIVADLCRRPASIAQADGTSRLVLGICADEANLGALQAQARRAGLDALGVEILPLGEADREPGRLRLRLAGAAARARAFDGDETHDAKLVLPTRLSRREVIGFARPQYVPAPSVDHSRCAVAQGCRSCVMACPADALDVVDGEISRDRDACLACGRCVTACPAGAVHNPGITPAQLQAQIRAMLDPGRGSPDPRGIVFTCRRSTRPDQTPDWYPVTVPCTGMVTPTWLLAPLLMGAGAVAAAPCPDGGCPLASLPDREQAIAWCRMTLEALGLGSERVRSEPDVVPPGATEQVALSDPFGPLGAAEVLLGLAAVAPVVDPRPLEAVGSPLGLVEIADEACTGCGTCALACPTGALGYEQRTTTAMLSFDHGRCTACGLCIERCPEADNGAITVSPRVDLRALGEGSTIVAENRLIACRSCGSPIAPAKVMDRIEELLEDQGGVMDHATRYCLSCRGSRSSPPPRLSPPPQECPR